MVLVRHALPIVAAAALLGACAGLGTRQFPMGSSSAAVTQSMGRPTAEHALPGGGRRLEYAGGTFGRHTLMFDFDAADRLVAADQVRTERHFATIQPGMTAAEVQSRIGLPSTTWGIRLQRQTVWSYRYEALFCQWFMVGMSPEGRVMDTSYGPDPLCDDNFNRLGKRR